MPRMKKTHSERRKDFCVICMRRKKEMRPLNATIRDIIISKELLKSVDLNDERYPSGICGTCRLILYRSRSDELCLESLHIYDHSVLPPLRPLTRTNDECDCILCDPSKYVDVKCCRT